MGLVRFIAQDMYEPANTQCKLEHFMSRMRDIKTYTIRPNGEVTVIYDQHRISDELIEDVLRRQGFQLKHIKDELVPDDAQVPQALEN